MKSKKKVRRKTYRKRRTQKGGMQSLKNLFSGIRSKIISIANTIVPVNKELKHFDNITKIL